MQLLCSCGDIRCEPEVPTHMTTRGHFKSAVSFAIALTVAAVATGFATGGQRDGDRDDRFDHDWDHDRGWGGEHDEPHAFAVGLWGDLPYSDLQALTGVPNLIADMNRQNLAFSVHDGDLKVGSGVIGSVTPSRCTDDLYAEALGYLNALKAPAILTPGDNDWTDCDRPANGGFSSLERLDYERRIFFNDRFSQGQHRLRQEVQTDVLCLGVSGPVPCVENRRWMHGGVLFFTMNVPGSCNNLCDTNPDPTEYQIRNAANILWMQQSFAKAKARRAAAVMIIAQANPGWDLTDPTRAPTRFPTTLIENDADAAADGYKAYLLALRAEVTAFRKPVSYVHGDSHYFRIDKPFLDAQGRRLENFTRVETFGDNQANGNNDVHWVKVRVDARSREVFAYQPQIVPANRTAVPAP